MHTSDKDPLNQVNQGQNPPPADHQAIELSDQTFTLIPDTSNTHDNILDVSISIPGFEPPAGHPVPLDTRRELLDLCKDYYSKPYDFSPSSKASVQVGVEIEFEAVHPDGTPAMIFERGFTGIRHFLDGSVTVVNELPKHVLEAGTTVEATLNRTYDEAASYYRNAWMTAHDTIERHGAMLLCSEMMPWYPDSSFNPASRLDEARYQYFTDSLAHITANREPMEWRCRGRYGDLTVESNIFDDGKALTVSHSICSNSSDTSDNHANGPSQPLSSHKVEVDHGVHWLGTMFRQTALQFHFQPAGVRGDLLETQKHIAEAANSAPLSLIGQLSLFGGGSIFNGDAGITAGKLFGRSYEGPQRLSIGMTRYSSGDPNRMQVDLIESMNAEQLILMDPHLASKQGIEGNSLSDEQKVDMIMGTTHPLIRLKFSENVPRFELRVGGNRFPQDNLEHEMFVVGCMRGLPEFLREHNIDLSNPAAMEATLPWSQIESAVSALMIHGPHAELNKGFSDLMKKCGKSTNETVTAREFVSDIIIPAVERGLIQHGVQPYRIRELIESYKARLDENYPEILLPDQPDKQATTDATPLKKDATKAPNCNGVNNGIIERAIQRTLTQSGETEAEASRLLQLWLMRLSQDEDFIRDSKGTLHQAWKSQATRIGSREWKQNLLDWAKREEDRLSSRVSRPSLNSWS